MQDYWNNEEKAIRSKAYPKKSEKYEEHQKLIHALNADHYDDAKTALLEKWLTLCRNHFVNECMSWRLNYHALRLTKKEEDWILPRMKQLIS